MIVETKINPILYCCETKNGKIHKFKEFMDCWNMILFYQGFNTKVKFFIEEIEETE